MKALLIAATLFISTCAAFAGTGDLKVYRTLLRVGAKHEQFMSKIHIFLADVECKRGPDWIAYSCHFTDRADDVESKVNLNCMKSFRLFNLLAHTGAPAKTIDRETVIRAKAIKCSQAVPDVADGTEAERTRCWLLI